MLPPNQDIENRKPVWDALSDLYLDTEIQDYTLASIADTCARSPYSIVEIERIMFLEVQPIVGINLKSITGVWDYFDQEWLAEKIMTRYKRHSWRFWNIHLGKRYFGKQWRDIISKIQEIRDTNVHEQ